MKSFLKNSQFKICFKFTLYFSILFALIIFSNTVSAEGQSLLHIATNIKSSLQNVVNLIVGISYVAGLSFAFMGMLKFKAHKDNPAQVPLSQPIVLLAISAALVFLPSLVTSGGETLWKGTQTSTFTNM